MQLATLLSPVRNFVRGITADLNSLDRDPGIRINGTAQCFKNAIQIHQIEPCKETLNRLLHRRDQT